MKRVFSGVQPTGNIHIGNYIGAIKQFVELQETMDCFFCVVDLHSITLPQNPEELYKHTLDVAALYMAVGIDPKKATIFIQSHVPAHTELSWLLLCNSYMGELSRMTQFKDKSSGKDAVPTGLFAYPALMAADILLYDTHIVPVGSDQKQHLELTRDIAIRFNNRFGETFVVPDVKIKEVGAKIMALDEPTKKMSKSAENPLSRISLLDTPAQIKKSIMKSTTDSDNEIRYDVENKPGISNLLTIYSLFSGLTIPEIENKYKDSGYGTLKKDLVEVVTGSLSEIQDKFYKIRESEELKIILQEGAAKANTIANETLARAKKKLGFVML
ncbi:tryptophan--tRNA ligase [Geosporobacter ferrireducens]|uniref:Tryptophan--tRNA ligase n=1 Tax=Geosporobacter ferrireducens TaxID=1424294 RepID=A0A1D8GHQ8_9FIRM|nr:tryptophan--tRNA ligase [Geosporobacter ferrireducens]AOT70449.1 tryptophan--tRNA ligase [Geosporobacter ferrireducens]MTI57206.1 tryptophan--tRNA ligase [Geosporobacter ferrireducens]